MKSVTLYRPVSIEKAMSDFDRYMESFFGGSLPAPAGKTHRLPAMDIEESDDRYSVNLELPGFDEKNIEVHVEGKAITVESKREESGDTTLESSAETKTGENTEEKKARYILKERKQSYFKRTFSLPENADYESISAKFKNGILTLDVKKRPESKKRAIHIEGS